MLWILLTIPMTANASSGDDLTINIGLVILSTAITIYRCKKYLGSRMKDQLQTVIDTKPAIATAIIGGGISLTAANIISLIGLVVGVAGAVVGILQWRENKRRNDELKRQNDIAERRLTWEMSDKGPL
ncbi:hypothetical protein ZP9_00036 [Shewanella phage ZP9]|nr:hypothetical protein ZP9_00036 [Shewanella phage ZP9]